MAQENDMVYPELAEDAPDLSVEVGGLSMKNPVTVASGTFGAGEEYSDLVDIERLGAVTTKGVSSEPWAGNDAPRIAETASGMLNSIGLQNPGVEAFCEHQLAWLSDKDTKVIVNVSGHSLEEYVRVIERLEDEARVDAYEVNISCPNVDAGGMTFGVDPEMAGKVTSACRAVTKRPLFVKLTPNVTDIAEIACAVEAAGADAVSLVNTLLGMAIDAERKRPKLARVVGGLSGPAIKPVALRMVWEVHNAVEIPLIGMGGIVTGTDAIEFMLAGASAVAVGAANFADPLATVHVLEGIVDYCRRHGVSSVSELIGSLEV
ncbi:MAG: dihydroorotate dehydrogenase [Coriobacteriales bacterium]|jgi:dihydroorotate dehydrogenase (NAD+) catalytic subunit